MNDLVLLLNRVYGPIMGWLSIIAITGVGIVLLGYPLIKGKKFRGKPMNVAQSYGQALLIQLLVTTVISLLCGLALWMTTDTATSPTPPVPPGIISGPGATASSSSGSAAPASSSSSASTTTRPSASSSSSFEQSFMQTHFFPWFDLYAAERVENAGLTNNSNGTIAQTGASINLNVTAFSVLIHSIIMILTVLLHQFQYNALSGSDSDNRALSEWGHNILGVQEGFKSIFRIVLLIMTLLIFVSISWLRFTGTTGTMFLPVWIWSAAIFQVLLGIGLLLSKGERPERIREEEEEVKKSTLSHRDWELFISSVFDGGFLILRRDSIRKRLVKLPLFVPSESEEDVYADSPVPLEDRVEPEDASEDPESLESVGDLPNLSSRQPQFGYEVDPSTFQPTDTVAETELLWSPPLQLWKHQLEFKRHIIDNIDKPVNALNKVWYDAPILSTQLGSGKTTAIWETVAFIVFNKKYNCLLLYPDREKAHAAYEHFSNRVRKQNLETELAVFFAERNKRPDQEPNVIISYVDWLNEDLLPRHDIQAHIDSKLGSGNYFSRFLEQLGLYVLEDIEQLSGVRATNFAPVHWRFQKILQEKYRVPCLGISINANDAEASGVEEYARHLAGNYPIFSIEQDCSPTIPTHLYLLKKTPRLFDANEIDRLPEMASIAFVSWNWGSTVHLSESISVQQEDLQSPHWVSKPIDNALSSYEDNCQNEWNHPPNLLLSRSDSWVHIVEVPLAGIFSLPQQVGNAMTSMQKNHRYDIELSEERLVVLVPDPRYSLLIEFIVEMWIQSTDDRSTWNRLYNLGTRLICGQKPGKDILKQHIMAALCEIPSSKETIANMFTDDALTTEVIEELTQQHLIDTREAKHVEMKNNQPEVQTEELYFVRNGRDDYRKTSLDLSDIQSIVIREASSPDVLLKLDAQVAFRIMYPNALFFYNGERYRVSGGQQFEQTWAELKRWQQTPTLAIDKEVYFIVRVEDTLAFTTPIYKRQREVVRVYSMQQINQTKMCRAEMKIHEEYVGCIEKRLNSDANDVTYGSPIPLTWSSSVDALMVFLPVSFQEREMVDIDETEPPPLPDLDDGTIPIDPSVFKLFRRMASVAVIALTKLSDMDVSIEADMFANIEMSHDILTQFPNLSEYSGRCICFTIYDLKHGNTGIIDSLGDSPWRFIENLCFLLENWADFLQTKGGLEWAEIDSPLYLEDELDIDLPNILKVKELCRAIRVG